MPRAARRILLLPGTLTAHPWRASTLAARRQKARGHHYPHHQNGHQYQNIPHGELLLAYDCRNGRTMPATSGASASVRPPLPNGNSVRTPPPAWCVSPQLRSRAVRQPPRLPKPTPRATTRHSQRATNTKGSPLRVSLWEGEAVAVRKGVSSPIPRPRDNTPFPNGAILCRGQEKRRFCKGSVRQPLCEAASITDDDRNALFRTRPAQKRRLTTPSGKSARLGMAC